MVDQSSNRCAGDLLTIASIPLQITAQTVLHNLQIDNRT